MFKFARTKPVTAAIGALLAVTLLTLTGCGTGEHAGSAASGGQPTGTTVEASTSTPATPASTAPPESAAVPCTLPASEMITLVDAGQITAADLTQWQRVVTAGCPGRQPDLDSAVAHWNQLEAARQAQQTQEAQAAARAEQEAAEQSAAELAAAEAAASQAAQENLYETGWYDERGWVSPQTAQRAKDAGIPAGDLVPNYLRCGTICGESPTSGEVQQQWMEQQGLVNPDGSPVGDPCTGGYPMGGTCYPDYSSAAAACGGYLIRGSCYPSAEAARAAGEGE